MQPVEVTDPQDPRLSDYVGLTDSVRRVKHEPAAGFFLAEGQLVMRRAAQAGCTARSLLLAPNRVDDLLPELAALGCPVYVGAAEVLHAVTGFHVHRGALGSFTRPAPRTAAELLSTSRRVLVLEEVNSPTNLGAIFRSAAGLGMDAVILSPTCCDPLYRRAMRVSMGEVLALPYAYADSWPAGLDQIRAAGFRLFALTPAASATPLDAVAVSDRVAIVLGAEGHGLSAQALEASDVRVRIPMAAGVDSLNVGAAAAIACWALGRRA